VPDHHDPHHTSDLARPLVVAVRDATVRVGGRTVWSHLDLAVAPGEFTAILGPNGAGKSTLLKVLLGMLPLAAGTAEVLGAPAGVRRDRIGYLPQHRQLEAAEHIRAREIVRLGLDGPRWGFPLPGLNRRGRQATSTRVEEIIDLVGAGPYAHRPFGELSGGEQQRILIAQAVVRKPGLLILDEPLDSLDLPNQGAVVGLIRAVCTSQRVAALLVAHDVNPLLPALDQVLYIANGRGFQGPVGSVITSERLSALFGVEIEVLTARDGRLVVVGQPEAPHHHGHRHDEHGHVHP
jgi:zinc/manganese transport system ATP-binding protein